MKQIRINLTDAQHEKLMDKLHNGAKTNLEHGALSGFSMTLEEAFPGITWLTINMNGALDLGDVNWEII